MKYIPKYITTDILAEYGEHLTHEAYNEMVKLNITQGDYNTTVLNQLFNTDEGIQIPYLDNNIKKVTDDQAIINKDMNNIIAEMIALKGSLSKYTTFKDVRRIVTESTQGFVRTNKIKAGENVEVVVDANNNVIISATGGGGGGDVTKSYVDEQDATTLQSSKGYTDTKISQIPIPVVPTNISAFNNDVGYITDYTETDPIFSASAAAGITSEDITDWNNKSTFSGDYNDLTNKPTIPVVPTNVSAFTNDAGYLTSESDPYFSASPAAGIQATDITVWNNKSDFSGDYNDLTNKPIIPSSKINAINYNGINNIILENIHEHTFINGGVTYYVKGTSTDTTSKTIYNMDYYHIVPDYNSLSNGDPCIIGYRIDGYNGNNNTLGRVSNDVIIWRKNNTSTSGLDDASYLINRQTNLNKVLTTEVTPTISKLWKFTTLPQSSVVPTNNDDLVNKAYVDGAIPTEIHYVKDSDLINSCFILKGKTKGIYLFTHAVGLLYDSTNTPSQTNPEVCRSGILWLNKDVDPSDTTGGVVGAMVSHAHSQNGETYVPSDCTMIITAPTMPSTMSGVILSGGTGSPVNAVTPDVIAPNYSWQNTYNTGDLVTYNRKLYQCNSNNVTGTWNSSYWTQKTLADLL